MKLQEMVFDSETIALFVTEQDGKWNYWLQFFDEQTSEVYVLDEACDPFESKEEAIADFYNWTQTSQQYFVEHNRDRVRRERGE